MDIVIYEVWSNGGGVDGMDRSDKPKMLSVHTSRESADANIGSNKNWCNIKVSVLEDYDLQVKQARNRLSAMDRFLLLGVDSD